MVLSPGTNVKMAQPVKDSFLDLERHRQLLEENTEKLRKSLRHWQMWEAEYEGLKEEILAVDSSNHAQLLAIANAYDGELVTKKEVEDILGVPKQRSAAQAVNLLDRRMDYVEHNIRTVQRQVEAAESKLAAASIISAPEIRNEEGLPMTEIIEELDAEGNVVSSRTSTPGDARPQLLEVLQKAGIKDLTTASLPPIQAPNGISSSDEPILEKAFESKRVPNATKKGVSFSEDTKPGPEPQKSQTAVRLEAIMQMAKQQEKQPDDPAIIPQNESAEDAALRREMLQYGMSEVGAVVAELQLEEASDWSDADYEDGTSSTEDEDEDAFGRSTGKIIDDELRQRMLELEERLGVRAMKNVGKNAVEHDIVQEGIGRVAIKGEDGIGSSKAIPTNSAMGEKSTENISAKKSVRFSEELDISAAATEPIAPLTKPDARLPAPVGDVVERVLTAQNSSAPPPQPQKKASRFKTLRGNVLNGPLASPNISHLPLQPAKPTTPKPFSTSIQFSPATDLERRVPTGPQGAILAPKVIERDVSLNSSAAAPDELDPHLLNQEVATEYHRRRNRMIGKQGGFTKEEESEIVPFTEEEGGPRKMSRFKAARLSKS
jgi:unconventional prefoldin RPB5 interactor 1